MDAEHQLHVQRAVAFFRQAGLERLLVLLRAKYIELGQVGGQVQLVESTTRERRELASFLGRAPYRDTTIRMRLSDMDSALRASGFHCTLLDLLQAYFPGQPLVTRPQQRAAHSSHQTAFRRQLEAIAQAQPDASRGQQWLLQGQHGLEWLFARYKNVSLEEQQRQLATITYVAELLQQLPGPARPERLGLFAQRTSGDPHSLDSTRPAGRLFLQALDDLSIASSTLAGQGRVQDIRLYQDVGLQVDTISSYVAVFNLQLANKHDGSPDPMIKAAGPRILLLPLRQLLQWRSVTVVNNSIYVIENPQVFEEVIEHLQSKQESGEKQPTIVCTAGWPSVAAVTLLDLLLAADANKRLYYSGDFDLKGLQIAAQLMERYPARCLPWHIDAAAYAIAMQADGISARENDLQQLSTLPAAFAALVEVIQAQGKWAYQEGITSILAEDVSQGSETV